MTSTPVVPRGIQIHPTRQCNLRCRHCYSSSAPQYREQLDIALIADALADARSEGYEIANFSGGEPLLYRHLAAALDHARRCGMVTTLTSNGMLLDDRRLATLEGLDVLAISIDGAPDTHNSMRASHRAFDTMRARLQGVRRLGLRFGFLFTLTRFNLDQLEWVARFAQGEGAQFLNVNPLELVGRASASLTSAAPDETELAFAFLEAARLQEELGPGMTIHLDSVDRDTLRSCPERVFADKGFADAAVAPLSTLFSPLVIEADGTAVPVGYGFARQFALGNLKQDRLRDLASRWRARHQARFREACRSAFEEAAGPHELPFANWYDIIARHAATASP